MKTILVISMLSLCTSAFAQMSGTYDVITSDCNSFILSQSRTAVVKATDSKFQLGFLSNYSSPDGSMKLIAAFDFATGTKKVNCLTDACYTLNIGAYSADHKQYKQIVLHALTQTSQPEYRGEVSFTLTGNTLKVVNGQKQCILKKVQ